MLRAGQPREAFFSTFYMPDHTTHPTTVDVALAGGETIAMGDVRIEAIAAPGHTPGSFCYLLHRGGLRVLFAGDVIMMLRGDETPRTQLGIYSAYLAPTLSGRRERFARRTPRVADVAGPRPRAPRSPPRRTSPPESLPVPAAGNRCWMVVFVRWRRSWPDTNPTAPISWTGFPRLCYRTSITWEISGVWPCTDSSSHPGSSS